MPSFPPEQHKLMYKTNKKLNKLAFKGHFLNFENRKLILFSFIQLINVEKIPQPKRRYFLILNHLDPIIESILSVS